MSLNKSVKIYRSVEKADKALGVYKKKCDDVLIELLKYFDFEIESDFDTNLDFFHIEYQPSDGIILADNDANVYNLYAIISHIHENGNIKHIDELNQFKI